jgi:hypothetical protein
VAADRSDLLRAGIRHRVVAENNVDVRIECAEDKAVFLLIPRDFDKARTMFSETKRQVLESLISQLTKQLAVEALEGR